MVRSSIIFGGIYSLSFIFLIVHLNFNVKTFKLTQQLQSTTLEIYDVSAYVDTKELEYYSQTNPDKVYQYVTSQLGMIRQDKINVFTNQSVSIR